MEILFGLAIFFVFIVAAIKIGAVLLKVGFTIIGAIAGVFVIILLIPLSIGFLLIPLIIIGIIAAVIKCIRLIL